MANQNQAFLFKVNIAIHSHGLCVALTQLFRITRKQTKACFTPSDLAALLLLSFYNLGNEQRAQAASWGMTQELMGRDTCFLEAPAHLSTRAQSRTETQCEARKPGAAAQLCLLHEGTPQARTGPSKSSFLSGLLLSGDWTLSLTHYKHTANFCLSAGKAKTKTRHLHLLESLVTFEWVSINNCAVLFVRGKAGRRQGWNMHMGGAHKTLKKKEAINVLQSQK